MNLNSHILLALAVAMALFHRVDLAILVGIGAAIPDLDREYVFTRRKFFRTHQLHRALLHNLFFVGALAAFNQYLGLGVLLHVTLDMLTSPADRGVEILFPLTFWGVKGAEVPLREVGDEYPPYRNLLY